MAAAASVSIEQRELVEAQVRRHGFGVVVSDEASSSLGGSAYTVGLFAMGLPELIATGWAAHQTLDALVSLVARRLIEPGADGVDTLAKRELRFGDPVERIRLLRVPGTTAMRLAPYAWARSVGRSDFVQLCVADENGRWPWDKGFLMKPQRSRASDSKDVAPTGACE